MRHCTIALAGNPNAGKSTVFNVLTGSHQHVGNWPGKTVEKKVGTLFYHGQQIEIIDLPGTYSLSAYSLEEQIARDFLIRERPDVVVNVVDAANLERNLYLTVQILETGLPMILGLNMLDLAQQRGITIDDRRLAEHLGGVPVIPLVARAGQGIAELKHAMATMGCIVETPPPSVVLPHRQGEPVA